MILQQPSCRLGTASRPTSHATQVSFVYLTDKQLQIILRFEDELVLSVAFETDPFSLPAEVRLADTNVEPESAPWAVWNPKNYDSTFEWWSSTGETVRVSLEDDEFIEMEFDLKLKPFGVHNTSRTKPISGKVRAPFVGIVCDTSDNECSKYDTLPVSQERQSIDL